MTKELTFDIIALIGALCGVIMVVGGMILLRVGAIRLSEAAGKGEFALSITKDIKLTTSYPALAIFALGVVFVGLSLHMTRPDLDLPVEVMGQLNVPDPSGIKVEIQPDQMTVNGGLDSTGRFYKTMSPRMNKVSVAFYASGYRPVPNQSMPIVRELDITPGLFGKNPSVRLPNDLRFEKIASNPGVGKIQDVANAAALAPLNANPSF